MEKEIENLMNIIKNEKKKNYLIWILWPILLVQIKGCGLLVCVKRWKSYSIWF